MGNPSAYYDSFADELKSKFQRIKNLVPHRVSSGDYHEEIIREALRNFLPKRFSVKKGFVYKDANNTSKQVDILIVDEYVASAYVFQEGDFVIVRPDAVVAAMEVKTTLDATSFDLALRNVASVKQLFEYPSRVTGMIFGYQGTQPSPTTLHKWFTSKAAKELASDRRYAPNLISFFKYETLLVIYNAETKHINEGEHYHAFVQRLEIDKQKEPQKSGWQLSILLALILNICKQREFQITNTFSDSSEANDLLRSADCKITSEAFKFGEGGATYTP